MKVFLTGASGFVGGRVWSRLQERGHDVLATGKRALQRSGYRPLDLSQAFDVPFEPDVVIHAAARSSPWGSSAAFQRQNVDATRHVLDFCERHGRPHLVHISTGAVLYRNEHQLNLAEDTPCPVTGINTYAHTKRHAERLVEGYGGPWSILRPRAVFGPGDTVVFPRILRAMSRGKLPIIEAEAPVMADLIHVDALADYIVTAAEKRVRGYYHLSHGQPVEINAFLARVCAELGYAAPRRRLKVKTALRLAALSEAVYRALPFLGEPPLTRFGVSVFAYSKTFDISKTLRDLGPASVSLEAGVNAFVSWQKAQTSTTEHR